MILFFFISFICSVYSEYHVTIMLISSPKKIPMLTYTIEYFLNAYYYNHDGFVIDGFYLSKGCECDHSEIYNVAELLKSNGIKTYVNDNLDFYIKEGTDRMNKMKNFHSWWANAYLLKYAPNQKYQTTLLYMKVNSFFNQTLQIIKKNQGYPEYILFLEDDVAFRKSFFIELKEYMEMGEDVVATKIAYPPKTKRMKKDFITEKQKAIVHEDFGVC